ncbi:hypothetical protein [Propylenella binzhouense]|uniref:Uncharacterized protein n=1 Tax=Propylenella binzhouense TaxID=2555902 RepID=A0A964T8C6_9HYPH|nr:hypothetical protein [Propylenella binzhouense]MYZ49727.1 hypothetical protein [Propylenella binzhouense]
MSASCFAARPVGLLDRVPERLLLTGIRGWMAGYASGDLRHWEDVWNLHATSLGVPAARQVVERLAAFVSMIRDCAQCPMRCFPGACPRLCRDECLALAMVSASQNADLDCLAYAMARFIDPEGQEAAMPPLVAYAEAMVEQQLRLMPVPRHVIQDIAERPPRACLH